MFGVLVSVNVLIIYNADSPDCAQNDRVIFHIASGSKLWQGRLGFVPVQYGNAASVTSLSSTLTAPTICWNLVVFSVTKQLVCNKSLLPDFHVLH